METKQNFTRQEAAEYLFCSVAHLENIAWSDRRRVAEGLPPELPYTKVGKRCIYSKCSLDRYKATKTIGDVEAA